jgi:hypothetical protein
LGGEKQIGHMYSDNRGRPSSPLSESDVGGLRFWGRFEGGGDAWSVGFVVAPAWGTGDSEEDASANVSGGCVKACVIL